MRLFDNMMIFHRQILIVIAVFITSGCATHTRIHNTFKPETYQEKEYYNNKLTDLSEQGDMFLALSFSGGGTRAAAFSYGVLSELRDTQISLNNESRRMLDEVDHISSVSGGSFTAAYYGLFGDQIFEDYETVFLRQNVQKTLINSVLNPINWPRLLSSGFDRGSLSINYYDKQIFREKTFGDMVNNGSPFIQINATDIGTGQAFGFTNEAFAVLCSNLQDFKVARAVAASSAVPVAFPPVTLKNYVGCDTKLLQTVLDSKKESVKETQLKSLLMDLDTLFNKNQRQYIHLVDGGISDNLGIRPMVYRMLLLNELYIKTKTVDGRGIRIPRNFVIILVNAQTSPDRPMDKSPDAPSGIQVMNAVSGAQIRRDNMETISQTKQFFEATAQKFSDEGQKINTYFIELKFNDILDLRQRNIFNNMATSFSLPDDQVDLLIKSGRLLLRKSEEFQRLVKNLSSQGQ